MNTPNSKPIFEIHLEEWHHALHLTPRNSNASEICMNILFPLLEKYEVHPTIYYLSGMISGRDMFEFRQRGWKYASHGVHHYYDEKADRSPYFNQEGIPFPPSGGFFFRVLPLWYIKWAIKKSGTFWIHPHDLDESHPKVSGAWINFKRHVGIKTAKKKLEKLLKEVRFE